jgi:hypothetical protein
MGAFKIAAADYRVANLHKRISNSKKVGNPNHNFKYPRQQQANH